MRANALLVRSKFGWTYETAAGDEVIENLLELGALPSAAEVSRFAQAQIDRLSVDQTQIGVELVKGYVPPFEGDTLVIDGGTERVVSWQINRDRSTGEVACRLELRSRLLEEAERVDQALRKMSDGTMRGDSTVATPTRRDPASDREQQPSSVVPVIFDRDAPVTASESKPWTADRSGFITQVSVDIPGGEDCDLEVRQDGSAVVSLNLTGVTQHQENGLAVAIAKGDVITVYSVDTGFDLVVSVQFV